MRFASLAAVVVAVTLVVPALSSAAERPVAADRRPPALASTCTNATKLQAWKLGRLARQTIAVPVEESDVAAVEAAAKSAYGGILLFGTSAPANLGTRLTQLRDDVPYKLGLLVMTDEEGGGVQRMANLVGSLPWAAYMGQHWSPKRIWATAKAVGANMARNGVDMDLAPVLDVDGRAVEPGANDPDGFRSFSGSTSVVTADGVAFMAGMRAGGDVPVVKHFPGLGGVSGNTDDAPAHTLPWPTLERVALPPFVAAIKAGAPAIMVSNASVPKFTSLPASLSPRVVTRELRDALGFKGLIITDSLSALAIVDPPLSLTVPQASVDALVAGDDMVLFSLGNSASADLSEASSIATAIVTAVGHHTLSKTQLVEAAAQVLTAKGINLCASS